MLNNSTAALEMPPLGSSTVPVLNPLTRIWRLLDGNLTLNKCFPEFIKLAEIAMIHVLGSVEDERTFSSLNFLKDRLWNRLDMHSRSLLACMVNKYTKWKIFHMMLVLSNGFSRQRFIAMGCLPSLCDR
jgi:hypothetical protein